MEQCQLCSAHDSSLNCVAPDTHNTGNMSETSQLSGLRGRDSWRKEKKKKKKENTTKQRCRGIFTSSDIKRLPAKLNMWPDIL